MTTFASPRKLAPGLVLLAGVAICARVVADVLPLVNALVLAVVIGSAFSNAIGIPERALPGIGRHKLLLEIGIVLMAVRLSLDQIAAAGALILGLAFCTVLFGIALVELLARTLFDLDTGTTSILAAGASVCGVSAVVAVASGVEVEDEQIAYAVATILLFDAITLVAYPVVGAVLNLPPKTFGLWAGLSMFSTGPVTVVGFSHSDIAGQWATVSKLVRNSFIGVVAVLYSVHYSWQNSGSVDGGRSAVLKRVYDQFPKFLVGFLLVALLANAGAFTSDQITTINAASDWTFALAFAGLGFDIRVDKMRQAGVAPVFLVAIHLVTMAVLTFATVTLLLPGGG